MWCQYRIFYILYILVLQAISNWTWNNNRNAYLIGYINNQVLVTLLPVTFLWAQREQRFNNSVNLVFFNLSALQKLIITYF
jgi:hypothetical protein